MCVCVCGGERETIYDVKLSSLKKYIRFFFVRIYLYIHWRVKDFTEDSQNHQQRALWDFRNFLAVIRYCVQVTNLRASYRGHQESRSHVNFAYCALRFSFVFCTVRGVIPAVTGFTLLTHCQISKKSFVATCSSYLGETRRILPHNIYPLLKMIDIHSTRIILTLSTIIFIAMRWSVCFFAICFRVVWAVHF